jgi:hypothetical protein
MANQAKGMQKDDGEKHMTTPAVTVELEIGELRMMLNRAQEVCEDLMSLVDHQYQGDEAVIVRRRNRDKQTAEALMECVGIIKTRFNLDGE